MVSVLESGTKLQGGRRAPKGGRRSAQPADTTGTLGAFLLNQTSRIKRPMRHLKSHPISTLAEGGGQVPKGSAEDGPARIDCAL